MKQTLNLFSLAAFLIALYLFSSSPAAILAADSLNPVVVLGLVVAGAYLSASTRTKVRPVIPDYLFNIGQSLGGGILMGAGFVLAGLPELGNTLAMIHGVFYWVSFIMPQGVVYLSGMFIGGAAAAGLQKWLYRQTRFSPMPQASRERLSQGTRVFTIIMGVIILGAVLTAVGRTESGKLLVAAAALMGLFGGFFLERSRICMGLMMKELFLAKSGRTLLRVVTVTVILALAWTLLPASPPAGLPVTFYMLLGSILMGSGFMLADGCYMGSLWKAGQGYLTSYIALFGILIGTGLCSVLKTVPLTQLTAFNTIIPGPVSPEWPVIAIKVGLALFIGIWIGVYLMERPAKPAKRGPVVIWLASEAALLTTVAIIAVTAKIPFPVFIQAAGISVFYAAVGLYLWARLSLGQYWSDAVLLRQGHRRVVSGPYRYLKHPIYLSMTGGLAGAAVALGSLWGLVATILLVIPTLIVRARAEERLLVGVPEEDK